MNSETDKVSLITFDTATLARFDFETIGTKHIDALKSLTCDGKNTALFDSLDECLERFEKSVHIPKNALTSVYLFVLTDGGNNFGKRESALALGLARRSKQLEISGHMIQLGDSNCKRTRTICDVLQYKFNNYRGGGNAREFAHSFSDSIKTETRARAAQVRNRFARKLETQSSTNSTESFVSLLPEVPKTSSSTTQKNKVLA